MDKRIILAEDNRTLRIVMKMALCEKYEVVDVADGASLQQELETGSFDLVISDLNLPLSTGPDAVRKSTRIFSKTECLKNVITPVLVITGLDPDDPVVYKARRMERVVEVVHKPIDLPEFIAKVDALLRPAAPIIRQECSTLLDKVTTNALVISSEQDMQRLLTELCDIGGVQARACRDFHQARVLLASASYSMVVLDIMLTQYSRAEISCFLEADNMPPVLVLSPMKSDYTIAYLNFPSAVFKVLTHPLCVSELSEIVSELAGAEV